MMMNSMMWNVADCWVQLCLSSSVLVPAWCAAAVAAAGVCAGGTAHVIIVIIATCLLGCQSRPLQKDINQIVGQKVVLWSSISQVSACFSVIICKLFHQPPVKMRLAFIYASDHFPQHLQAGPVLAADLSEAALPPRQRDSDLLNTLYVPKDVRLLAMLSVATFPSCLLCRTQLEHFLVQMF